MKHAASRSLFAYWNALKGERTAPERSEIDPVAIRDILADTFVCEVDEDGGHPFRLAGTRLCGLFGRELKGRGFASLWDPGRTAVGAREAARLVQAVLAESRGVVAGLQGTTRGLKVLDLELLILPLRHAGKTHSRLLGCLSPSQPAPWAGLDPVVQLDLTSLRVIRDGDATGLEPTLRPDEPQAPPPPPERRGLFTVYRGGRQGTDRIAGRSS
jgi:hypothetical protein